MQNDYTTYKTGLKRCKMTMTRHKTGLKCCKTTTKGEQNDYNSNAENECEEIQNNDKGMQNIYNKTQIKTSV